MNPPNSVAPPAGDATQSSAETVYAQHRRQSVLAAVEAEQLDWQITASEAEIAAIAADIQREKERAQQLRRHHLRLDRLHAELQQRNRQAKASYEQLDGKLAQMHDIDRTADAASKQRQEDIAAALVKMGDLKAQIVKGNEQLEDSNQLLALTRTEIDTMRIQLTQSHAACAAVQQQVDQQLAKLAHADDHLQQRQATIAELRAQMAERQQRHDSERCHQQAQRDRHAQLSADWLDRQAALVVKRQQVEQLEQKRDQLYQEFESLLEQLTISAIRNEAALRQRRDEQMAAGVGTVQYTSAEVASVPQVVEYLSKMEL